MLGQLLIIVSFIVVAIASHRLGKKVGAHIIIEQVEKVYPDIRKTMIDFGMEELRKLKQENLANSLANKGKI